MIKSPLVKYQGSVSGQRRRVTKARKKDRKQHKKLESGNLREIFVIPETNDSINRTATKKLCRNIDCEDLMMLGFGFSSATVICRHPVLRRPWVDKETGSSHVVILWRTVQDCDALCTFFFALIQVLCGPKEIK